MARRYYEQWRQKSTMACFVDQNAAATIGVAEAKPTPKKVLADGMQVGSSNSTSASPITPPHPLTPSCIVQYT
jgi:hypothetical protein